LGDLSGSIRDANFTHDEAVRAQTPEVPDRVTDGRQAPAAVIRRATRGIKAFMREPQPLTP
jgi:hypothetical protein